MDLWKIVLSGFGFLSVFVGGLFLTSKIRGSGLRKKLSTVVDSVEASQEQVHEIEVSVGKSEQQKEDLRTQINELDQEKPKEPSSNEAIVDFFDKMSKK